MTVAGDAGLISEEEEGRSGDEALLNGPQLDGEGVSQTDVDAMMSGAAPAVAAVAAVAVAAAVAPTPEPEPVAAPAPEPAAKEEEAAPASQADIDALFD